MKQDPPLLPLSLKGRVFLFSKKKREKNKKWWNQIRRQTQIWRERKWVYFSLLPFHPTQTSDEVRSVNASSQRERNPITHTAGRTTCTTVRCTVGTHTHTHSIHPNVLFRVPHHFSNHFFVASFECKANQLWPWGIWRPKTGFRRWSRYPELPSISHLTLWKTASSAWRCVTADVTQRNGQTEKYRVSF